MHDQLIIQINHQELLCKIGCLAHERHGKQKVVASIKLWLYPDEAIFTTDNVVNTVNYTDIVTQLNQIVDSTSFQLLENLAQYIIEHIFVTYKLVSTIEVKLTKLSLLPQNIDVVLKRHRTFKVALALGSNMSADPKKQLITAIELLTDYLDNIRVGHIYETLPQSDIKQNNFFNTAIVGNTTLLPQQLLSATHSIEKMMGKQELAIDGPRVIDIDIIMFANCIYNDLFLVIPHVKAQLRDFVLQPLCDIDPNIILPHSPHTILELLNHLPTRSIIRKAL
jgi:dihydroneopterin aldolase/2-amino-4-hydroxy-6-hydroxymethyldihydropteridine diphosphokinase